MPDVSARHARLVLIALLGVAAVVRAATLHFGLPSLNDQDELMFELGAVRMLRTHTLNPGWFGHPATTTMYVLALVDIAVYLTGRAAGWWAGAASFAATIYHDPTWVILPGRAAMLAFGLLTIALTYDLAARLFDRRAGLAAAALLALSPLHVACSQVIRSDMMACAFMLLAARAALRIADDGRWRHFARAGFWTGVAVATKWPYVLGMLAAAGAAALRWFAPAARRRAILARFAGSGLVAVMTLVAVSPFLMLTWPLVLQNLEGEGQAHHLGATGGPFAWNAWWYLSRPLLEGLGSAGLLLAGLGCVAIARNRRALAVIAPVAIGFLLIICAQNLVWARWALPLLPLLAIAAGAAAIRLVDAVPARPGRGLAALLGIVVLVPPAVAVVRDGRERMNDTRQQASAWLMRNVPHGSTVLVEHFGWDLVDAPYRFLWPVGGAGCLDPLSLLSGKVSYQTIDQFRQGRTNFDFGTVSSKRIATCRADYAIISQYDRYRAEQSLFPREYAQYRQFLAGARTLAVFRPERGVSGGWVVRVVKLGDRAAPRR